MSFGRYSDSSGRPTRTESYTERFRVQETPAAVSRVTRPDTHEPSRLAILVDRACDASNRQPNLSLNLEIADLINEKKGNSAREAATQVVKLINSRSATVSILALALLDICVKNCGYPFHLQISRKEFLNELVRKFPERPPPRYSRTQELILECIEEWRETICRTSRYKEDLGYIRDMHRLLAYKGYNFPEVNRDDAAVLNPSDNIKSSEELEEEERDAQSAKLQELIRRGTPADLLEANRLMKIMAGYDKEHQTDYRAEVAEELAKIQRKAKLLDEMLDGVRNGGMIGRQDAFEELFGAIKNAQPKIQKIIKDESDDVEAVHRLLALNDYINTVVQKYETVRTTKRPSSSSSVTSSAEPSRAGSPVSVQPQKPAAKSTGPQNLIDFDDETEVSGTSQQAIFLSVSPSPSPMIGTPPPAMATPAIPVSPITTTTATTSTSPGVVTGGGINAASKAAIMAQFNATPLPSTTPQPPTTQFSALFTAMTQPQQPQSQFQFQPQQSQMQWQPSAMPTTTPLSAPFSPMPLQQPIQQRSVQQLAASQQQQQQQQQQTTQSNSSSLLDLEGLF
ncbi:VHS domain-containing protein [Limtongia smithiae]|uniref:VHS domain-containing protein n=1 Tax=Limtongia smithiae TaxID=1125753 RepID=UPI0034CE097D